MLEEQLKRIADSLEILVRSVSGSQLVADPSAKPSEIGLPSSLPPVAEVPKPARKRATAGPTTQAPTLTPAVPVAGSPVPTIDDVSDALRALVSVKGAVYAKELLARYGAENMSTIKPENYKAIHDEMVKSAK